MVQTYEFTSKFTQRLDGYEFGFCRPSRRSITGNVFIAEFNSFDSAKNASSVWGSLLPARCKGAALRQLGEGRFSISVPIAN